MPGHPRLIVIRGNSGSGKSSVAKEVRRRYGRGCALIEQDYLRRILLREHDGISGGLAPRLIESTTRTALDGGYHVVLEGILHARTYGPMLRALITGHPGASHVYYLDVSFPETVRRHASRPQTFTAAQMGEWYVPGDVLGVAGERVVPETSTFAETVGEILGTSGLRAAPATAPCPALCVRCWGGEPGRPCSAAPGP
jgi:predicted kinase